MKATYKGPEIAVEVFGIIFPRGQGVEVADAHAQTKLRGHPEFEIDEKPRKAPEKVPKGAE